MLVSKPTHGGGPPLGIDLEAGVARITVAKPPPGPEPEATADPADDPARPDDPAGDDPGPPG